MNKILKEVKDDVEKVLVKEDHSYEIVDTKKTVKKAPHRKPEKLLLQVPIEDDDDDEEEEFYQPNQPTTQSFNDAIGKSWDAPIELD